ncbi:hypothetical protein IFM53868_05091 [Aspergillus udagawae]|uniref:Calcineurin-like phosphoesterase domain-containing protein n=1 Tax=Aspergillus udagawae TaxID=91492 RepID=A0ABQ1ASG0_9EURO|nr:hypothetical protein IFM53868_05091 [Aspergillus udagawae]
MMKPLALICLIGIQTLSGAAGMVGNVTAGECEDCQSTLAYLQAIAFIGDEAFVDMLQQRCGEPLDGDENFCRGVIALEGPVVADTLRKVKPSSRAAVLLCIALLGACQYPPVSPYNVSFPFDGRCHGLPLSEMSLMAVDKPSMMDNRKPLRIAHFSDLHVDLLYANYTLADEPGHNDAPAALFGDHNCGAPPNLEASMYQAIQELLPDFSIFTGDIVDHAIWNTSAHHNEMTIRSTYSAMNKAGMGTVYSTLVNHEMSPTNAVPSSRVGKSAQWLFNLASNMWSRQMGTSSSSDIRTYGRYSVKHPGSKLRIISIHTNLYYTFNFWMYQVVDDPDPDNQFNGLSTNWTPPKEMVVNRYQSTIAAMFFGHTHLDQFKISYSDYQAQTAETAVSVSYIAPSLSPLSGMPAFRIYTVDPITFGVLDVETYTADIARGGFDVQPIWSRTFSARKEYGSHVDPPLGDSLRSSELTPAFWHNVTRILELNTTALDFYWARRTHGWNVQPCDLDCRKREICQLRAARSQDNCHQLMPTNLLGRRHSSERARSHELLA